MKEQLRRDFIVERSHEWSGNEHPDAITIEEGVEIAKFYDAGADYQRDVSSLRSGSHAVRSGLLDVPVSRRG